MAPILQACLVWYDTLRYCACGTWYWYCKTSIPYQYLISHLMLSSTKFALLPASISFLQINHIFHGNKQNQLITMRCKAVLPGLEISRNDFFLLLPASIDISIKIPVELRQRFYSTVLYDMSRVISYIFFFRHTLTKPNILNLKIFCRFIILITNKN